MAVILYIDFILWDLNALQRIDDYRSITLFSSRRKGSSKIFRTIMVWIIVLLHSISKSKSQEPQSPRPQNLLTSLKLFWKSLQQKSDSHCSRATILDHTSFLAPFASESLFCCTLFLKGKSKKLEVKGSKIYCPLQNYSENHCNKRVIRTALERTLRIF